MKWALLLWATGGDMAPLEIGLFPSEQECRKAGMLIQLVAGKAKNPDEKEALNQMLLSGLESKCEMK
ncbi:hypothetical protein ACIGFL_20700 [Pseudomonas sp. NPDC077649]|uniref:hypothetical protein n=1 Tax=Pseudomonas sp. NPDC077649 TaxID=3364423 RepID=UPI0037C8193E